MVGLVGLVGLVGVRRLVKSPRLLGFLPRRVLLEPQKVVLRPVLPLVLPLPGLNHEVRRVFLPPAVPRVRLPAARVRPRVVPLALRVPGRRPVRLVEPLGRRNGLRERVVQVPVLRS